MPTSTKVSSTSWLRCRAFGLCVALSACSTGDLPSLGVCDECYVFDPDYHSKRAKLRGRAERATCTDFVVDSGATLHCINDKSMFETVYTDQQRVSVKVADGKTIDTTAVGTVFFAQLLSGWKSMASDFIKVFETMGFFSPY